MRKKLKLMQIATIIFMLALAIVHFLYLNKPVITDLSNLSANQLMTINGKKTPIVKTDKKLRYPASETGFQYQMGIWKTRLCFIEINGVVAPVLGTGSFSETEKMVALVRPISDELNKIMELDKYKMEYSNKEFADYILVQQRSLIEILLMTIVAILGLKLIGMSFSRAKETVNA